MIISKRTVRKYLMFIIFLGSGAISSCSRNEENHKKMIAIVEEINQKNFDKRNPFCSEAEIAFFSSLSGMDHNTRRGKVASHQMAIAYLKEGQEEKAVKILEQISNLQPLGQFEIEETFMRGSLGIANMRLGERQNCVKEHNAESCIIPIVNNGIHAIKTGSRRATEIYQQLLERDPNDYESRWLLNIAYMTLGEYPSGVPQKWLIADLDKDPTDIGVKPFIDGAADLGLNTQNRAGGVIIDDFDNDGYNDIITSDWSLDQEMHYFKSNPDGTFTDISQKSGLNRIKGGLNITQADYNNDGYLDILVLRGAWMGDQFGKQPNSLLRNNGDGTFTDVTIQSGLLSFHPTQAAVWRDFNNDGWLDLFIGNETENGGEPHGSELYLSNRDGTFTDVATEAGCDINAFIKGVTAADYNNDGLQDIFVSTLRGYKVLLKNKGVVNGKLQFENVSEAAGIRNISVSTFSTWFWDYDNDGWQDIFVCGYQMDRNAAYSLATEMLGFQNFASKMYLYRNNQDGTFKDVSNEVGLGHAVFGMGANFGDFDNDGYLDMYIGTGNPDYSALVPNKLYKNDGGVKFRDVTIAGRVGNVQKGHGVSFSDIDNDGDSDIYIVVGGAYKGDTYTNSLYLNPGQNDNNWLKVSLEGRKSNRSAIGSKIRVSFTENGVKRVVYRELNSGGSFGSSPLRSEIGLGRAKVIDELAITWAGEKVPLVFKNIKPNQVLRITEGKGSFETISLNRAVFKKKDSQIPICNTPKVLLTQK